jgi:hypothetical protein
MAIGGIVSTLRFAPLSSVLYVAPFGRSCLVQLRDGCSYEAVKFPEGALQLVESSEATSSGTLYTAEVSGQLSPVCEAHSELLERYCLTPFICIAQLKNGEQKLIGDANVGCTLQLEAEVSADFSANAYSVTIACISMHESYFLQVLSPPAGSG